MNPTDVQLSIEKLVLEVKDFIHALARKQIKASTIHVYVFHYEAENEYEFDKYLVNVKVCYSDGEQNTFFDGFTFTDLKACQSHLRMIEKQLISNGFEDLLLIDIEPN